MSKILEMAQNFPPKMGKKVEFYYRRGNRFFFRSEDKEHKMWLVVSDSFLKEAISKFKRGVLISIE